MNQPEIQIAVTTRFLSEQSEPANDRFAFAYTISITNRGRQTVRLLRRHWLITDGNNHTQEVRGDGVVGEQPWIGSGETFRYTSGAVLKTAVGSMQGSYQMITDSGELFDAPIPAFSLAHPTALH